MRRGHRVFPDPVKDSSRSSRRPVTTLDRSDLGLKPHRHLRRLPHPLSQGLRSHLIWDLKRRFLQLLLVLPLPRLRPPPPPQDLLRPADGMSSQI